MNYSDKGEIGRGGFGVVRRVQADNGHDYAIKLLSIPPTLDPANMKRRFEREVKYQSSLNHENVVKILESNLAADPPWFVMPLASMSLAQEISTDKTLGGNIKIALFHILNGLEEIHRRGFCHRDLKPANVLKFTTAQGQPLYALSDFGLIAVGEDGSSTLTPSGAGGGTPLYQAPECANNFHRATAKSDIYSFGAILFDLFAPNPRRLPHDELSFPGNIGQVIEKCTKRNPHRRYKNVSDLREALFEALDTHTFTYQSDEEATKVAWLADETTLPSSDQWDEIFGFIEDNIESFDVMYNIFRALRREHIQQLHDEDSGLMSALGSFFADHCRKHAFGFDYSDVLASKAQLFYDLGDIGLKAEIAIAMLELGTSHNRWFVERKFLQMAGPNIEDALAERIATEIDVLNVDFNTQFGHLSRSVSATIDQIHPLLRRLLI